MPKESVIKSLLSLQQAVEKTGIGYDTLLSAVKHGELVAFRPGGRKYLIHKKDLNAYLEQFKPKPKPEPLFVLDNSRNIEIALQASKLISEAKLVMALADEILQEIK